MHPKARASAAAAVVARNRRRIRFRRSVVAIVSEYVVGGSRMRSRMPMRDAVAGVGWVVGAALAAASLKVTDEVMAAEVR